MYHPSGHVSTHCLNSKAPIDQLTLSGGWVRDWKPGPPPKTAEERIAAAKKYNLIPEGNLFC